MPVANVVRANTQPTIEESLQATIKLLAQLAKEKFFGEVALQFIDGRIANIRKNQNLKPHELK